MNNKSRNTHACGPFTLGNLSNNKFVKDYYNDVKPYLCNSVEDISKTPDVDDLMQLAKQEFINYYGTFPTCAIFAPAYLNIAGAGTGFAESKSLCMHTKNITEAGITTLYGCLRLSPLEIKQAIQLVTVIVGKRNRSRKWCHVKTLSEEITGQKVFAFYLNTENLNVSAEETSWIRYVKGALQSFKAKRGYVPGFKIVIISNVPIKRGLGSSSALVVAIYTFLEAITNTYTSSVFEKTLACHLAETLAINSADVCVVDILTSIVGQENKMFAIDAQSLRIRECDWNPVDVELVLITSGDTKTEGTLKSRRDIIHSKAVSTVVNTACKWRQYDSSLMNLLFPREVMNYRKVISDEDNRISKMTDLITRGQWKTLGKLLWENYHSSCKYLSSLPDDIERIMTTLETIEGVFGAKVISRGYGACIVALVQKSRLKSFVYILNRIKTKQQRYYIAKASMGSAVLHTYEDYFYPLDEIKCQKYRANQITKYHLRQTDYSDINFHNDTSEPSKSISMFIPAGTFLD